MIGPRADEFRAVGSSSSHVDRSAFDAGRREWSAPACHRFVVYA